MLPPRLTRRLTVSASPASPRAPPRLLPLAFFPLRPLLSTSERKYFMLGGKGGAGKTSCAASLAVKFANHGHATIVVSTDPAHSLSDSFAQNLSGGTLVLVEGLNAPLFALEVMAVSESSKLHASLKKENVPVNRLIVNQLLPPPATDCKFCAVKRRDQMRATVMIHNDPELMGLKLIQSPSLVDVEIRGVPALRFLGDMVWK